VKTPFPHSLARIKARTEVCPQTGKQGHRTEKKALKFAQRSSQFTGLRLYAYRCRHCPGWHMTKQPSRAKAAR
jgi:hypothetical protein